MSFPVICAESNIPSELESREVKLSEIPSPFASVLPRSTLESPSTSASHGSIIPSPSESE